MEQPADHLAAGIKAGDRLPVGADDLGPFGDLEAAEAEGDAAGHTVGNKRRGIEPLRPVRFGRLDPLGAQAVELAGIEVAMPGGGVIRPQGLIRRGARDIEFRHQIFQSIRRHRIGGRIARLEQMGDLGIEDLIGDAVGLVEDDAAELGVGIELRVLALIDETKAQFVDHHAVGIGEPVGLIRHLALTVSGRLGVDRRRVTTAPLPVRQRPDRQRHAQTVALIVQRSPDLGVIPGPAEILGAPGHIGLETAARQDHGGAGDFTQAVRGLDDDPFDAPAPVLQELGGAALVADFDPVLLGDPEPARRQPDAFVLGADDGALGPFYDVADLDPAKREGEFHLDAVIGQPADHIEGVGNHDIGKLRVGAALGHAHEVGEERFFRVRLDAVHETGDVPGLGHDFQQFLDIREGEAEKPAAEKGVAAARSPRRFFQRHDAFGAGLAGRNAGRQRRVAGADDDDIIIRHSSLPDPSTYRSARWPWPPALLSPGPSQAWYRARGYMIA